jgi:predicted PurR-regulated permease PerM
MKLNKISFGILSTIAIALTARSIVFFNLLNPILALIAKVGITVPASILSSSVGVAAISLLLGAIIVGGIYTLASKLKPSTTDNSSHITEEASTSNEFQVSIQNTLEGITLHFKNQHGHKCDRYFSANFVSAFCQPVTMLRPNRVRQIPPVEASAIQSEKKDHIPAATHLAL